MTVFIGTSGWQYRDWRGRFYPPGLPVKAWLGYFSSRFQTTEVNNTFYRLPEAHTFDKWDRTVPPDFIFSLKFSRLLTHVRGLKDPEEPVDRFMSHASSLRHRLGAVLVQTPPWLGLSAERLAETLQRFPAGVRVAVELRNDEWFCDEVFSLLEEHNAALCLADRGSHPVTPLATTAGWGYIRMHEGTASPAPSYGRASLDSWAERIADLWPRDADVYVYFNNDTRACAVRDAHSMALACAHHGLPVSRTSSVGELHLQGMQS